MNRLSRIGFLSLVVASSLAVGCGGDDDDDGDFVFAPDSGSGAPDGGKNPPPFPVVDAAPIADAQPIADADPSAPDGGPLPDAGLVPDGGLVPDASTANCTALASYDGSLFETEAQGTSTTGLAGVGSLNQEAPFDTFVLELWPGYEPFYGPDGIPDDYDDDNEANDDDVVVGGTYVLEGSQLDYATCSVCLFISSDFIPAEDPQNNVYGPTYFATGGTITLTSIGPTSLTFTGTNLTLQESNINPDTLETTPAASGCTTTIPSVTFDVPLNNPT